MKYRIYFNKREAAPQVWSVDQGSIASEMHAQFVNINVPAMSSFDATVTNPDEPCAWLACEGRAFMGGGGITIEPLA